MALWSPFRRKSPSTNIEFSPTFIPLSIIDGLVTSGLNASQEKFLKLYLTVPELQAVINFKARIFAGMRVTAINESGDEQPVPQVDLFAQPNPLQNFKEFATQYYVLRAIFGNEFIHPVFGTAKDNVKALWNLPPMDAEVIPVKGGIPFNMTEINELIEAYKFNYQGSKIVYPANEIIHFNDNQVVFDKERILLGDSKLRPLVQACENIKNAYEARGILINQSPLGILSNETTDQMGRVELMPGDKDDLHIDFEKTYGKIRDKRSIIITNANLKWQSMSTDVGRLKLFEEVTEDFKAISNAHNFPPEVLLTDTTYDNKNKALIQLYQEAIIPEADEFLQGLTNWMGLSVVLKSDFSHVAVLQSDLSLRAKAIDSAAKGLSKAVEGGFLQLPEAEEEMKKYLT